MKNDGLTRREFVATGVAAASLLATACLESNVGPVFKLEDAELLSRPGTLTGTPIIGTSPIGIGATRDGFIFVPSTYTPGTPLPLIILIHGAGQTSAFWNGTTIKALAEEYKVILLAPDSRGQDWDYIEDRLFSIDVDFIDQALAKVFSTYSIDPSRIAMSGFSDGASYTLSLGIINSDFILSVIAFSPATMNVPVRKGAPRVFVAHGTEDTIAPVARSRDGIVPALFAAGLSPKYVEFTGGHTIPPAVERQSVEWLVTLA